MSTLGRSFVPSLDVHGPYVVERTRLGIESPFVPPDVVVEMGVLLLQRELELAGIAPVTLGRIWSHAGRSEAGIFVDRAAIRVLADDSAKVTLKVSVSSPALRAGMWTMLGASLVAGFFATPMVVDVDGMNGRLLLCISLGLGLAVMIPSMLFVTWLVRRQPVPPIVDRVNDVVRAWVNTAATPTAEPKRTKRKKATASGHAEEPAPAA